MSLVVLTSGGLDSTLVAVLAAKRGVIVHPLFINYGQHAAVREWNACRRAFNALGLPKPKPMDLSGFGTRVKSGLTSKRLRIREDAFLPGRNLLLLLAGASYARTLHASAVAIGLLSEKNSIFPDQTRRFLDAARRAVEIACNGAMDIVAPLMDMTKPDVLLLATAHQIRGTYSCHSGGKRACGACISCREIRAAKRALKNKEA